MSIPQRRPDSRRPREAGYLLFTLAGVFALFTASALVGAGGHWTAVQVWWAAVTVALAAFGAWRRRPAAAAASIKTVRRGLRRAARLRRPHRTSVPEPAPVPATQPALVGTVVGVDGDGDA